MSVQIRPILIKSVLRSHYLLRTIIVHWRWYYAYGLYISRLLINERDVNFDDVISCPSWLPSLINRSRSLQSSIFIMFRSPFNTERINECAFECKPEVKSFLSKLINARKQGRDGNSRRLPYFRNMHGGRERREGYLISVVRICITLCRAINSFFAFLS